ncbi:MAG: hypothetical protein PHI85_11020 [Victivallaceae bacterium]|nr:hypothetical protein [Victivallaceae bacterium]
MKKITTFLAVCLCLFFTAAGGEIELEGEIGFVSDYPSPEAADYPDCGYSFSLTVKGVGDAGYALPGEIAVIATAFTGRKLSPQAGFERGERVRLKLIPFEEADETLRARQTADQIADVTMPQFFLVGGERVGLFDPVWAADFTPVENDELPVPPAFPFFERTPAQEAERTRFINEDLAYIDGLLNEIGGGDFSKWNAALKPLREEYGGTVAEKWVGKTWFKTGGWVFGGTFDDTASFRSAVMAMNDYLRSRNVDLIVMRIPGRAEICADLFNPEIRRSVVNPAYYELQKYLLEHDVEYVDLTAAMVARRLEYTAPYWYFEPGEGHAAEGGCRVVASEISRRIARYDLPRDLPAAAELKTIDGMYHYPAGNPDFDPSKPIAVSAVWLNGRPLPIAEDGDSPLLLMGDSYFTHPSMTQGATIQHYTALESRVVPDLLCRMSAGNGLPRFLSRKGDGYLAPRRVVVWVTKPDTVFKKIIPFDPPVYFSRRELLRSISGAELKSLDFSGNGPDGAPFAGFYSDEDGGVFKLVPSNLGTLEKNGSGPAGTLKMDVGEFAGKYKYYQVEMRMAWNWTVTCEVSCGDWSDVSFLSLSDYSRRVEYLVPASSEADTIRFDYRMVKVLRGKTMTIKSIKIYGVD